MLHYQTPRECIKYFHLSNFCKAILVGLSVGLIVERLDFVLPWRIFVEMA